MNHAHTLAADAAAPGLAVVADPVQKLAADAAVLGLAVVADPAHTLAADAAAALGLAVVAGSRMI
jgi:hypothetical protein